jgi:hypothetical protein
MKLTQIINENQEEKRPLSNEVKKHFLEIVSTYNKYQEMMDRKSDLATVAETLGGITEAARTLAIHEGDDWFDKQTIKRNMSELDKLGKEFDKCATEANSLDQRLHGLYEDMGHILSRYYKIGDITEEQMKERLGMNESHSNCGCGCGGTTVGGCSTSVNEAKQLVSKVNSSNVENFFKKYPKIKDVMLNIAKRNADIEKGYDIFQKILNDNHSTLGAKKEKVYIQNVGDVYVNTYDWSGMKGFQEAFQYIFDKKNESVSEETLTEKNVPTDPGKWSYYKAQAKKKFDVYPSAYANGWASKQYKAAGGGWKKGKSESVNEDIEPQTKKIASLTGTRPDAVKHFVSKHALNITKLLKFIEKGKLSDRMDFSTALAGKDGNPIQKKMIKMFQESVTEAKFGYKDSTASYINNHKDEYKIAEKMNKGNEKKFYDDLQAMEDKLGHSKTMLFISNALRGYGVDMYKDPKIKNPQDAQEALFLLSK